MITPKAGLSVSRQCTLLGIARAMRGSGARLDFGIHQPPGGEGQHLAHKISVGALLDQLQKRHSVVGHRHLRFRGSSSQLEP